jgi:hypothetical protein
MAFPFKVENCYPTTPSCWLGRRFAGAEDFDSFLASDVKTRVSDAEFQNDFEQDLQALATTQMSSQALASVLNAQAPILDWEIGEAIAECLLGYELNVVWPWNENRDRKTPRASLPGPDIVGIAEENGNAVLLYGEVKTSSDKNRPPGVMSGRHGLAHQIDDLVNRQDLQMVLLKWLYPLCRASRLVTSLIHLASRSFAQSAISPPKSIMVSIRTVPSIFDCWGFRAEQLSPCLTFSERRSECRSRMHEVGSTNLTQKVGVTLSERRLSSIDEHGK